MTELETLKAQLATLDRDMRESASHHVIVVEQLQKELRESEAQVRELRKLLERHDTCSLRNSSTYARSSLAEATAAALRSAPPNGSKLTEWDFDIPRDNRFHDWPINKTNAGEERKDLARQGCTDETRNDPAAGKRPIEAGAEQVPADEARCCAINNVGDNCLMKVGHEGICIFVPEPQDSPSRSEIEKLLMALANCYILMQPEGFEVGFICEALGGKPHIHNGKLMLPAPPSPAREKEKAE